MTARDYLAAVQQRAKSSGTLSELGERLVELEETTDRLASALTAALDHTQFPMAVTDEYSDGYNAALRDVGAAITDALTPKESDS